MADRSHIEDRLSHWLLRLYPRAWRERYGDEFLALIEARGLTARQAMDVIQAAAGERADAAIRTLLGDSSDERWRSLRSILHAVSGRLLASFAGTAAGLTAVCWMDGIAPPVFRGATWTPAFAITLLLATLGVASASYFLGWAVLLVRGRFSRNSLREPSWLLSIAIITAVNIAAMHPFHDLGAASLQVINHALGANNMLWVVTAQWGLPASMAPWYHARRSGNLT